MKKILLGLTVLFIAQNAHTSWFPWCCGDSDEAVRPSAPVRPQPQAARRSQIILPARLQPVRDQVPSQVPQSAHGAQAYQILVAQPERLQHTDSQNNSVEQSNEVQEPQQAHISGTQHMAPATQSTETEFDEPLVSARTVHSDQNSLRSQSTVLNSRPFVIHSRSGLDSAEIPVLGVNDPSRSLPSDIRSDEVQDVRFLNSRLPSRILTPVHYSVESIQAFVISQNENDASNIPGFISSQDSREF